MNILEELTADHKRLTRLLALFDRELDEYEESGDANLSLMQDIAQYYADYFNRFHHPLEDCLRERLRLQQPAARLDNAADEHERLLQVTQTLLTALDEVMHGSILPRADLIDAGCRFVDANLHHMHREELGPFVQADVRLSESDWQFLRTRSAALQAHVDLGQSRHQYDAILESLTTA